MSAHWAETDYRRLSAGQHAVLREGKGKGPVNVQNNKRKSLQSTEVPGSIIQLKHKLHHIQSHICRTQSTDCTAVAHIVSRSVLYIGCVLTLKTHHSVGPVVHD